MYLNMDLIDLFFGQDLNSAHMILLPHATLATQRDSPSVPSCLFHRGNPSFLVAIEYLLKPELIIVGWKDLRIWDGIALQLCIEMFLLIANLSLMAGNDTARPSDLYCCGWFQQRHPGVPPLHSQEHHLLRRVHAGLLHVRQRQHRAPACHRWGFGQQGDHHGPVFAGSRWSHLRGGFYQLPFVNLLGRLCLDICLLDITANASVGYWKWAWIVETNWHLIDNVLFLTSRTKFGTSWSESVRAWAFFFFLLFTDCSIQINATAPYLY